MQKRHQEVVAKCYVITVPQQEVRKKTWHSYVMHAAQQRSWDRVADATASLAWQLWAEIIRN